MNNDYAEEREPLDTKSMLEEGFLKNLPGKVKHKASESVREEHAAQSIVREGSEELLLKAYDIRDNLIYNKRGMKHRTWLQESGGLAIALVVSILVRSSLPFLSGLFGQCMLDWVCDFESTPLAPFYNGLNTRGIIICEATVELLTPVVLGVVLLGLELYRRKQFLIAVND